MGVDSITFFSDIQLLMYRNATDFCILILYPPVFPNSLMSSSCFLVAALGMNMYIPCHMQTVRVSLFLLQTGIFCLH